MTTNDIRTKYLEFFKSRDHTIIPRANLVPQEDPTTLFTGSGMQPLIPYLLGQPHPAGDRLVNSQTCFRAEDIDEVGDNRHTTYFEMLGNWGLGSYFKAQQLPWFFEFLTHELKLDPTKLYISVFAGHPGYKIPADEESVKIWQKLFAGVDIDSKAVHGAALEGMQGGRIFYYDATKNWWSRAGVPENMPEGEPGGPDSEVFYDFGTEHDKAYGEHCHPNCDCGRFLEIGNSVFMQYRKTASGVEQLPQKNVDFGGGLERIAAAVNDDPDMFKIDVIWPLVEKIESISDSDYGKDRLAMQVIADHLRSVVFLAADGVVPSNTAQGYVMRRFLRRAIRQALNLDIQSDLTEQVAPVVIDIYKEAYPELQERQNVILDILDKEESLFRKTLERGVREFTKLVKGKLTGETAFTLFDTYGFPPELTQEEAQALKLEVDPSWQADFDKLMTQQKERSRTATTGQFKGGLADHSEIATKYHTATHLMYKALRQVLGDHVVQRGSNITPERLRFDFSHSEKMTPEQIAAVEKMVNDNIAKDWPMGYREIPTKQAFKEGALGAFGDKYGETVKVYTAGDPEGEWFSKEICGGPHVEHTGTLGEGGKQFKITKEESSSAGVRRIKAVLQ